MRAAAIALALIASGMRLALAQSCPDARVEELADSTVSLSTDRHARGTAWFGAPNKIVTIEHVTRAIGIDVAWRHVRLSVPGTQNFITRARIVHQFSVRNLEHVQVLALETVPTWSTRMLKPRAQPLTRSESTVAIGHALADRHTAVGLFLGERYAAWPGDNTDVLYATFRFSDGTAKNPVVPGWSGGPIVDCEGRVVAVISTISPRFTYAVPVAGFARALLR